VPGVEEVADGVYRRSVRLAHGGGVVEIVACDDGRLQARLQVDERDRQPAIDASRRLFDLDADPQAIGAALSSDPIIGQLVQMNPGRRVPGISDPDELAIRAVLGQQVSVARAATLAGRLVSDVGEPLEHPVGGVTHLFPTAAAIAAVDPARLAMPASRQRAVTGLATALASGEIELDPDGDHELARARLLGLPGIGPWTVEYIAMRALRDSDAFLPTDLGVRHALRRLGLDDGPRQALEHAEGWRPYRAYGLQHLWASLH
jgi:AraC family transcriptional regulator of adaptative response / DNA-3-methyladenine glycosylase II